MAGLHDTEVIDLVAEEPDGSALLVIVKEGAWALDDIALLKAKLNTYAQFVLDGGLASHYPELLNRPVRIRIESAAPPSTTAQDILAVAQTKLKPYVIDVTHKVNPRL